MEIIKTNPSVLAPEGAVSALISTGGEFPFNFAEITAEREGELMVYVRIGNGRRAILTVSDGEVRLKVTEPDEE